MAFDALFLDFNSFFAAVEQHMNPALRGRPVAVVPVLAETTSCIAASYEAKAFGVKTGTRVSEAREWCPGITFIEAQHVHYVKFHHQLVSVVDSCVPVTEVRSIDEMWCELIGREREAGNAVALAQQIKQCIRDQVGESLTSSIGLAPNWFLAKIASNMQKPDGLTLLTRHNLHERLFALQLSDIYGIGKRTEMRMNKAGIFSVEDLYAANKMALRNVYNSVQGERLYDLLRGRQVLTLPTERASIGHSHVLPPHMRGFPEALAVLHRLLQKAAMRLRKMRYAAGELTLSVRFLDKRTAKRYARFTATEDTLQLTHSLQTLWMSLTSEIETAVTYGVQPPIPQAVGVVLTKLVPVGEQTGDLFNEHQQRQHKALNATVDKLNSRFGKNTIWYGGATKALNEAPMRIAFTQIPDITTER